MFIIELFQHGFLVRAFEAGLAVAVVAPLIGVFLVLRRYSLIADTLAHVSLAGIAIGALLGIHPMISALGATILGSMGIERLRAKQKIYGESALAMFLSGSLALAIVVLSLNKSINVSVLNYLFGSIVTVTQTDVILVLALAALVIIVLKFFYKELVYVTFDEEAARVSGIPIALINGVLIFLSSLTVALAIPVVGVLLVSALVVMPVVCALRFRKSFFKTILIAEAISVFAVFAGIVISFYANLATSGAIVLIMLTIFALISFFKKG